MLLCVHAEKKFETRKLTRDESDELFCFSNEDNVDSGFFSLAAEAIGYRDKGSNGTRGRRDVGAGYNSFVSIRFSS